MSEQRPGALYAGWIAALGVLFLACGTYLSIHMIAAILGPFDFGARRAERHPGQGLGLWAPVSSESDESSAWVAAWRELVGESWDVAESEVLERLVDPPVRALLVRGVDVLAPEAIASLERYVAAGGALVVTGAIAPRGADPTEWSGPAKRIGGDPSGLLELARSTQWLPNDALYLVPRRAGPLLAGVAPDVQVPIRRVPWREGAAASWNPALPDDAAELSWHGGAGAAGKPAAASQRRAHGRGRWVWLAAGPERSGEPDLARWRPGARIHHNAIAWATRQPAASVSRWPGSGRPPPSEIDAWRRARSELRASVRVVSSRRVQIDVSNLGSKPVSDVAVHVYLNRPLPIHRVGVTALGQPAPHSELRSGAEILDLHVARLRAHGHQTFTLDSPEDAWETHRSAAR